MRNIILASVAALCLIGCERAVSNVQTFVSNDCGQSWERIEAGKAIPARMTPCDLKVQIPNYPMAGDARFRLAFEGNVLADTSVAYEYEITDGGLFLSEARYIGRQNTDGDSAANAVGQYETAENTIIDRRIRDALSAAAREQSLVSMDQGGLEDALLAGANASLAERGVTLIALSLVITPDELTRQAMDVASARAAYSGMGISDLGERLMVARAGAPRIVVEQTASAP